MERRQMQRLGHEVSVVGLGTWQLGADWGSVDPREAQATLEAAVGEGITTTFAPDDHRTYNRQGEMFDVGETFAGVPFAVGVRAARELSELVDPGATLAQFALRWVIDQPGLSTVIPGARNPDQVRGNAAAASLPPLREEQLAGVSDV